MPSVFICHASEDKDALVRPLAHALKEQRIDVWYDEFSMTIGDSLRESIDRGLAQSDYGIVVVSPSFFAKRWPQRELNGLVAREMADGRSVILPIWHDIDRDEILAHSPPLADTVAASSAMGLDLLVAKLLTVIRSEKSAVTIAREALLSWGGEDLPSATDDYWLDIAEIKEAQLRFPDQPLKWIFPLPFPNETDTVERGANLASTALQINWGNEAEHLGLCQLTRPETLHAFMREMPSMVETARAHPAVLALYAPQLTIPGFDQGFEDVFDALLDDPKAADGFPSYGAPDTIDDKPALCGDLIAWRHPSFGNITSRDLARSFVGAHISSYTRYSHSTFDCLAWLLSPHSDWLPERVRAMLLDGMRASGSWFEDMLKLSHGPLGDALLKKSKTKFSATPAVRADAEALFATALSRLDLATSPSRIAAAFFERGFIEGWYDEEAALQAMSDLHRSRATPSAEDTPANPPWAAQ